MINFYKLKKEYVTLEECSGLTLTASEMFNDQVVLVFGDVFTFLTSIYYYEEDKPIATNPAIIYDELIYENSYIKNQPKNIVIQEKNNSSLKKLKEFNLKHLKTEKTPIKSKLDEYEIMNRKTF